MDVIQVAKTCHEVNKAYCECLGDNSQIPWEDAPSWQKESAIDGVKFHLVNQNSKPCDSHNNWLKGKKKEGWKYGPVKDPIKKEHPCFISYDELPENQKFKDSLFIAVVRSFSGENK